MKKLFFINTIGLLLFFSSCGNQESTSTVFHVPSEEQWIAEEEKSQIKRLKELEKVAAQKIKELKNQLQDPNLCPPNRYHPKLSQVDKAAFEKTLQETIRKEEAKGLLVKVIFAIKKADEQFKKVSLDSAKASATEVQNYTIQAAEKIEGITGIESKIKHNIENIKIAVKDLLNLVDSLEKPRPYETNREWKIKEEKENIKRVISLKESVEYEAEAAIRLLR